MARNWKVGEAVRAIQKGNKEDILDIGRRFPLFANLAAQVNEASASILDCVPEYCSARKIESVLKDGVQEAQETEETEEENEEESKPVKKAAKNNEKKAPVKKAAKEDVENDEDSLESKSAKELFDMCKEAGLKVKAKQDKSVYIEALKAAEKDTEEEEDWGEEEEEEEEEEEAPKKPAKKAPAKAEKKKVAKKDDDDEDDDWDV